MRPSTISTAHQCASRRRICRCRRPTLSKISSCPMRGVSRRRCVAASEGKSMDVLMPQLGETVSSGKIVGWFKKVGDKIRPGDDLFEVETDKTSMEVPATVAGTLAEIKVSDGIEAPVGAVVAIIRTE